MVRKIVVTGPPCSGKSSLLNDAVRAIEKSGRYNCIYLTEAASELISEGMDPRNSGVFQRAVIDRQLRKEDGIVIPGNGKDTVIVFDRSAVDGNAYVTDNEWTDILAERSLDREKVFARYDACIFLESRFFIDPGAYYEGNDCRYEEPDEVEALCRRAAEVYSGFPGTFITIPASEDVNEKREKFIETVLKLAGI